MAGHSHASNVKHKKNAMDAKRSSVFTKLIKTIYTLAKNNPDPEKNPTLRTAIQKATSASVPKDKIENALKRASGEIGGEKLFDIRYNAMVGPVAIIIEAVTSNKNRTASDVRSLLSKHNGSLVETGSAEFMFDNLGVIIYPKNTLEDVAMECAISSDCQDFQVDDDSYRIITTKSSLHEVLRNTMPTLGEPKEVGISWIPKNFISIDQGAEQSLANLIATLEDHQDIESTYCNVDME
jgi:YebC/PmpR family DNA-binding regulatory protein